MLLFHLFDFSTHSQIRAPSQISSSLIDSKTIFYLNSSLSLSKFTLPDVSVSLKLPVILPLSGLSVLIKRNILCDAVGFSLTFEVFYPFCKTRDSTRNSYRFPVNEANRKVTKLNFLKELRRDVSPRELRRGGPRTFSTKSRCRFNDLYIFATFFTRHFRGTVNRRSKQRRRDYSHCDFPSPNLCLFLFHRMKRNFFRNEIKLNACWYFPLSYW